MALRDAQGERLEERRLAAAGIAQDAQPFEKERVGGRDDASALLDGDFPVAARALVRLFLRRHELSHEQGDVDVLRVELLGAPRDPRVPMLVDHALEAAPLGLPVAQAVAPSRFGSHTLGPVAQNLRAKAIDGIECLLVFAGRLDLIPECSLAFGVFVRLLDRILLEEPIRREVAGRRPCAARAALRRSPRPKKHSHCL